jgi:ribose transport system substrate-binding protein
MDKDDSSRYFVETAARVLDVLESFSSEEEELSITEVARRSGVTYSSAFRILYTLEKRGYVRRRPGKKSYVIAPSRKKFRIGYAALRNSRFHREVSASMATAARRLGLTLITRINDEYDVSKALLNVDRLIAEGIDLLIEYQYSETAAELIAAKCHRAGIPAISINFAQPGAYYYGGNNYQTGTLAGRFLSEHAAAHWKGKAECCLIMATKGLESTQEARKAGLIDTLRKHLPGLRASGLIMPDPGLTVNDGYRATVDMIRRAKGRRKHILIAALTDHLALGAEKAIREYGLEDFAVIVGQGGGRDARTRIASRGPFKASVAFFAESYGQSVLALAVRILEGRQVPLACYTNHVVLRADNLQEYYPREARA